MSTLDVPFSVEWVASFPLVGEVQTVPRAELYSIVFVVVKVAAGNVRIVSDSKINVDMYYQPRAEALASTNSDLWRLLFQQLDAKPIVFKLFWVPGHLDTKPLKVPRHVPDVSFALNHAADFFASKAAEVVEVPLHFASGALFYTKLVKQIQNRLTRVLITSCEKIKHEKALAPSRPSLPPIADAILASNHNIQQCGAELRCLDCSGSTSVTASNVRKWLATRCAPLPYEDTNAPVPVHGWYVVNIGNNIPNSSHEMYSIKGISFCQKCGAFSSKKCRLLNKPCRSFCTDYTTRALTKLRAGELASVTCAHHRFFLLTLASFSFLTTQMPISGKTSVCSFPFSQVFLVRHGSLASCAAWISGDVGLLGARVSVAEEAKKKRLRRIPPARSQGRWIEKNKETCSVCLIVCWSVSCCWVWLFLAIVVCLSVCLLVSFNYCVCARLFCFVVRLSGNSDILKMICAVWMSCWSDLGNIWGSFWVPGHSRAGCSWALLGPPRVNLKLPGIILGAPAALGGGKIAPKSNKQINKNWFRKIIAFEIEIEAKMIPKWSQKAPMQGRTSFQNKYNIESGFEYLCGVDFYKFRAAQNMQPKHWFSLRGLLKSEGR